MSQAATRPRRLLIFLTGISMLLLSISSFAISITDRRGEKLLVLLEGESVEKGDKFFAVDENNKRRALIEISQIKDDQAVAHIIKGTLAQDPKNYKLQAATKTQPKKEEASVPVEEKPAPPLPPTPLPAPARKLRGRTGVLLGYSQNSVKVNLTGASSVNLTGSGFSAEGFYEATIKNRFQILLRSGVQTLKASGTVAAASCTGSTNCDLNVTYLGVDAIGKYMLGSASYATWLGGGVSFLYGVSKSSNIVDTSKISFMQKLVAAGGGQYPLSKKTFIPVQLEYDLFLNSSSVNAAQIFVRAGYGWRF